MISRLRQPLAHQPISDEEVMTILRLHHLEKWPVGTIADHLCRHHDTVERILAHGGIPITKQAQRPRLVDAYLPFIEETLAKYPRLRASRLWAMAVARGYKGSKSGFRAIVSRMRHGGTRRRTCVGPCCPARRRRSTGRTSARSRSVARSARSSPS